MTCQSSAAPGRNLWPGAARSPNRRNCGRYRFPRSLDAIRTLSIWPRQRPIRDRPGINDSCRQPTTVRPIRATARSWFLSSAMAVNASWYLGLAGGPTSSLCRPSGSSARSSRIAGRSARSARGKVSEPDSARSGRRQSVDPQNRPRQGRSARCCRSLGQGQQGNRRQVDKLTTDPEDEVCALVLRN